MPPEIPPTATREHTRGDFHDEGHGYDVFGLHPPTLERFRDLVRPVSQRYFRATCTGTEHIPTSGPTILISNHSGILPVDAVLLGSSLLDQTQRIPRIVVDRFVPMLPWVGTFLSRAGAVVGSRGNVRRMLADGHLVVIFPEGITGPRKLTRDRYKLQDWRLGHVELALRHAATIVPAAVIGLEEAWPNLFRIPLKARPFGIPHVPIPASPLPLPARVRIRIGKPIEFPDDVPANAADDPHVLTELATHTRAVVERLMAEELDARTEVW